MKSPCTIAFSFLSAYTDYIQSQCAGGLSGRAGLLYSTFSDCKEISEQKGINYAGIKYVRFFMNTHKINMPLSVTSGRGFFYPEVNMCVGLAAKVMKVQDGMAVVDATGAQRTVSAELISDLEPGDYVMVHAGMAIAKITSDDKKETDSIMGAIN